VEVGGSLVAEARAAWASVDSGLSEIVAASVRGCLACEIGAACMQRASGAYEVFLNGKRVGDDVLAPGWTDFRQHVKYQTYDVTAQLASGKNVIAALLAPGWYETPLEWFQQPNNYGDTPPALRAQLRIEHTDGSVEWVATDASWMASTTSIQHSEIYDGETQDARKRSGWMKLRQCLGTSKKAIVIDPKPVTIEAQGYPSIRVERIMTPKTVSEPKPGVYVYDFGQNFSGVERLRVQGPRDTDVRLRFAEIVNADGTIYTDNLRTAKATDHFILSGNGVEEFTPQFTYHGFRYVELTGLPTAPGKDAVSAVAFHTDADFTAKLETGNAMINKLWSNILWGQRSNFVGVPSDCPQRDERLGWMADAQVFLANSELQHGSGGLFAQVCGRHARNADRDAVLRHLFAGYRDSRMRALARVGAMRA
jgi:alpha-L-rhamnosidase